MSEQINRRLHEYMGYCNHWDLPDYCTDLNAVAEVEVKFIAEKGLRKYAVLLIGVVDKTPNEEGHIGIVGAVNLLIGFCATATAKQRATAIYEDLEGQDAD